MQFWIYQAKARKTSFRLIALYALALIVFAFIAAWLIDLAWQYYDVYKSSYYRRLPEFHLALPVFGPRFLIILLLFATAVLFASRFAPVRKNSSGRSVAERLGGRLVMPQTVHPIERRLLNVVEEMSIASGLPVPPVYIIDDGSINAFAAGRSQNDAVVGGTRGALLNLDRDELQAVIAHEFSHILNGDMLLNMRLAQLLFGLMFMAELGRALISPLRGGWGKGESGGSGGGSSYSGSRSSGRSSSGSNKGAGALILLVLAIILICVVFGLISKFFGLIVQAAVCRQREYLADASAVQFTRSKALASALKKVAMPEAGSAIRKTSSMYSHFFFCPIKGSLFASHPALAERIRRIEPEWDGCMTPVEVQCGPDRPLDLELERAHMLWSASNPAARCSSGGKEAAHKAETKAGVRARLEAACHEPMDACGLVLAMLTQGQTSINNVPPACQENYPAFVPCYMALKILPSREKLALLEKAVPALKTLSREQFENLDKAMRSCVYADGAFSFQEWIVYQTVHSLVEAQFSRYSRRLKKISEIHTDTAVEKLLAALIYSHQNPEKFEPYATVCRRIFSLPLELAGIPAVSELCQSVEILQASPVTLRDDFLFGLRHVILDDRVETEEEILFLQMLSLCLNRPAPQVNLPSLEEISGLSG